MDDFFEPIAIDIEQALLSLGDGLIEYVIGKTADSNSRECDYNNKGFTHFCEILYGKPEIINSGEKYLIEYFMNHSILKDSLGNERDGGAGNTEADTLYVVTKNTEKDINYIDGSILPNKYPIILDR